jgi:hypothetical protein
MGDTVNLFHGTEVEKLDQILDNGIRSQAERGEAPELRSNQVRYNVNYFLDPESAEYTKERWMDSDSVYLEVEVPKDSLYVAKYGAGHVEKADIERLDEVARTYYESNPDEIFGPVMFITPDKIDPDQILAAKW